MRPFLPLLALLAAGLLAGCGEPAPSVPLAPDKKLPDVSKMSPEESQKLLDQDHAAGRK